MVLSQYLNPSDLQKELQKLTKILIKSLQLNT